MEHLHVRIHDYQHEFFEDNPYNKSLVVRQMLDDFMIQEGADPDEWNEMYGQ